MARGWRLVFPLPNHRVLTSRLRLRVAKSPTFTDLMINGLCLDKHRGFCDKHRKVYHVKTEEITFMKLDQRVAMLSLMRAFTLIELLVVVVTLAMLGALIGPALASSHDNGTRTVCFNNMRRLGMAVAMYGNENRDYMAP